MKKYKSAILLLLLSSRLLLPSAQAKSPVQAVHTTNTEQTIRKEVNASQQIKQLQKQLLQLQKKYQEAYHNYRKFHTLWVIEKLKCDPKYSNDYKRLKAAPDMFRAYHSRQ